MPLFFEIVVTVFLGLVLGSFSTAVAWREPRKLSWVGGPSSCTSCGNRLGVPDLFPFFSWLVLRGRCRHCKARVGMRYPLTEAGVLAACLGVYAVWGLTPAALAIMAAIPLLGALLVIDIEFMILPDRLVLLCFLPAIFFLFFSFDGPDYGIFALHLFAALLYGGLVWFAGRLVTSLKKKDALGFGDVKFFVLAGFWLGVSYLPVYFILSGVFGVLLGIVWHIAVKEKVFPFGPALIAALYTSLLLKGTGFFSDFLLN